METIMSIVGSALTAFSVFFAVIVYIRKRDADAFAALRTSLVEMRMARVLYERAMTEAAFSEIGVSISNQLRAIYPSSCTREDVVGLLTLREKHNYTITAIHLGLQDSKARKEAGERSDKLIAIPSQYESTMPLISEVLSRCLVYVTQTLEIVSSMSYYSTNLLEVIRQNEEYRNEVEKRLNEAESVDILFREIAELFYEVSTGAAKEARDIAASATRIIDIFTRNILNRSDAQLRRLRKRNEKIYRTTPLPTVIVDDIDRAFFYLDQIKGEFSDHEWDVMLEAKMDIHRLLS